MERKKPSEIFNQPSPAYLEAKEEKNTEDIFKLLGIEEKYYSR
jgi:hypothetical protein